LNKRVSWNSIFGQHKKEQGRSTYIGETVLHSSA
jgi:hypothetical protein